MAGLARGDVPLDPGVDDTLVRGLGCGELGAAAKSREGDLIRGKKRKADGELKTRDHLAHT